MSNHNYKAEERVMKERNIALCILFSIITCGIYSIYWFIVMTNDMEELTTEDGYMTAGGTAFFFSLFTCGLYSYYWSYKMGQKMNDLRVNDGSHHILFLVLQIFGLGIINYCIIQSEINNHVGVSVEY